MSHNYYLVLDKDEVGDATVTIVDVKVTKGRTRQALRRFCRGVEDRGMWCTPLHPTAAEVLMNALQESAELVSKTGIGPDQVAEACRAKGSA